MKQNRDERLDYELADIIMGKPHEFCVGSDAYRLYPVTFAKTFLLTRYIKKLGMDADILRTNPYFEAMRVSHEKKELVCDILAIHTTPNTYRDFIDTEGMKKRSERLQKVGYKDLASALLIVLSSDKTDEINKYLGMDKEHERMKQVLAVKKNTNNVSFGGVSLFGQFIAPLKEMGYSDDEILYERGYSFLRLMLSDKTTSVYLSDDELAKLPTLAIKAGTDAGDPANTENVLAMFEQRGVRTS